MLVSLILLILVIAISLFCIGLVFLSRNIAFTIRLYFTLSILCLIQWVTSLFLSNVDSSLTLFFNRLAYVGPLFALLFFSLFIDSFYFRGGRRLKALNVLSTVLATAAGIVAPTSLNVSSISPRLEDGVRVGYNIIPGSLSLFVLMAFFLLSVGLFVRLALAYKLTTDVERRPLKLIIGTLALATIVSLATNAVVPVVFGGSGLANILSNMTITIFISTVAYAVLKYSFLDVRLLIIRSVAYVAGLITLLAVGTVIEIAVFHVWGGDGALDARQIVLLALLLAAAALSFGPLRSLFAKVTSNLFFKNTYDPSAFIAAFNNNLVNSIDIDKLLTSSASLISGTLKSTFCMITVRNRGKDSAQYAMGTKGFLMSHDDYNNMMTLAFRTRQKIVSREALKHDSHNHKLYRIMAHHDIEAICNLLITTDNREKHVGCIILGSKKNGELYNKTDVSSLSIISNELVIAVQNAMRFKEIQRFNITLQDKIDDATKELRRANQRLRQLDQTKDDFISMASHQLRTPLTSVKGYVSMVLDGDAGSITKVQRKLLNQSFISAQRMVYLISDLLNVSRLKTGKFVIEPVPSNLAKVIQEEVEQLVETAKGRGLELIYHRPEHFPTLMLDETKLRQVIMNFIDNAIYYTPTGGHIEVRLVDKPESIEFTVTDDGIGVPKHEQHHLFSKFYRAHNAKRARPDGTGLGIFMAKKVIIAQGGAIIFRSQEGKGSTFGFTFAKKHLKEVDQSKKD